VVLAGDLGAEVALEGCEPAAGHVGGHPGGMFVEVGAQRVGVLAGGEVEGGISGFLFGRRGASRSSRRCRGAVGG
jgi:hypothetical protein